MKEKADKILEKLLLAAGSAFFAVVLVMTVLAAVNMKSDYDGLRNLDLSEDSRMTISYTDRLYAMLGFGIEIDHNDSGKAAELDDFIKTSLQAIDKRIISCGILYVMITLTAPAYYLYRKFGHNSAKHTLSAVVSGLALFAVLFSVTVLTHRILNIPFYFLKGRDLAVFAAGTSAVLGGSCFLAWLLRAIKFKKITAVIAVPAVFILFIFGCVSEARLFSARYVDSFDYLSETEDNVFAEDYEGNVRYDSERNVMIVNGKEYEPRQAENPDYQKGAARIGFYAFEAVNPYSGNGLFLVSETGEIEIPAIAVVLYLIKSAAWIVFSAYIKKKRDPQD